MLTVHQMVPVSLACLCILFACSAAAAAASDSGVKLPPGSYQLTCVVLDTRGNNLRAICQAFDGDWLTTDLHDPNRCIADISNENGKLTCNRNQVGPPDTYLEAFGNGAPGLGARLGPWVPMKEANWQLEHERWTFRDGAPQSHALAQTSDGYLWLGGPSGLYRFDGRRFELFHSQSGEEFLSANISALYAPPSGGLWIGYTFGGTSLLDKGRVKNYGGDFAANSGTIRLMVRDKDGNVWAAAYSSGLWRFEGSHWQHIGTDWNVPLKSAVEVAVDRDGNLWVGGERMLLCLKRGSRRFQVVHQNLPSNTQRISSVGRLMDQEGSLWFGSEKGLDRFFYSPLVKQELAQGGSYFGLVADDRGAVLIGGTGSPLYRASVGKTDVLILPKYLDWRVGSMYRAPDGTLWLGASDGLFHETLSHQRPSAKPGQHDVSLSLRNTLWQFTGRDWEIFELPKEGVDQGYFLQAITQDREGAVWVSFGRHGLYRFADGIWTRYGGRKDLPPTGVVSEFTDSLGRVWFGCTKNQLALLDGDRVRVFGPSDGIRLGNITAIYGRGPRVWIAGEFGLEQFDSGSFKDIAAVNDESLRGISGIVETANGDLWLNGFSGIFHIRQSELVEALNDPSYKVKGEHFGRRDGVPGFATQIRPLPSAVEASDGRIWFATTAGVVSLGPVHSEHRAAPPAVTIQSVSAADKTYEPTFPLKLPTYTSSVQISYSAVSLSDPEATRFRYKLQETDADWHEAGEATSVTYRSLPQGLYHFSVAATDTNGTWSDKSATAEFSILPAFYQTAWFRFLGVSAFFLLLWALYRLRRRHLATQFNLRLEERVRERIRIARELHDTLLQSFQALVLRLQAVSDSLNAGDSKQRLDRAIDQAAQAIVEGRDAVQGLRSSTTAKNGFAEALRTLGGELAGDQSIGPPVFQVDVAGTPRDLHPVLWNEAYRIAGEALRNAFQHAQANRIEIELHYDERQFRLRIRDDGKGIGPRAADSSTRVGHFGLNGIRERAKLIGANLEVWSKAECGTEIDLTLPASTAYARTAAQHRSWFIWKGTVVKS